MAATSSWSTRHSIPASSFLPLTPPFTSAAHVLVMGCGHPTPAGMMSKESSFPR